MSFWTDLRVPTQLELLVGFYDLAGYARHADKIDALELLDMMSGYFALTGRIISDADGLLIKTMGDAGLAAFPIDRIDAGVLAFKAVQTEGDAWLVRHGYKTRAVVKLNAGPVALGMVGRPGGEILDVYGKTVNLAAVLPSSGYAMTPAVFRRLAPETRKLFKKHTPPIRYIDVDERRPTGPDSVG